MTTTQQHELFGRWMDSNGMGEASDFVDGPCRVVETRDTVADFEAAMIEYRRHKTETFDGVECHEFTATQRFKGETRRDLYIADFGDVRLVYAS